MSGSPTARAPLHDVSPELVLVDPELAAVARSLLPEPGARAPRHGVTAVAAPVRRTCASVEVPSRPASRERRTRSVPLVAAVVVAACVGVLVPASAYRAPSAQAVLTNASPVAMRAQAARDARAARTYTWSAVPGADAYEIEILKGERTVYEAVTRVAAVTLPDQLRFSPGRYTLSVTARSALSAASSARPLMETAFVVAAT